MKSRETLVRLKKFQVEEKKRKVAQIESMFRVNVLGVGVSALNLPQTTQRILDAARRRERGYVAVTGVHGVMEAQRDPAFRRILNGAFLTAPDGMPMTWGMAAMEGYVPDRDSVVVRKLREAGAIIVGKTNTPELGILPVTEPDANGPTRNPWDTGRTPGDLLRRCRRVRGLVPRRRPLPAGDVRQAAPRGPPRRRRRILAARARDLAR